MKKQEKNKRKKEIKKMQKNNANKNKNQPIITKEIISLPRLELSKAKKGEGEKAYVIFLLREIIKKCEEEIEINRKRPLDIEFKEWVNELHEITLSETWYYYKKVNELKLNDAELHTINIIRNTPKIYLSNWNDYSLNIVERCVIYVQIYALLFRIRHTQEWNQEKWRLTRLNMLMSLCMLLKGIEQRMIEDITIYCDDRENILDVTWKHGEKITNYHRKHIESITDDMFAYKEWTWKKCNKEGQVIKVSNDVSDIVSSNTISKSLKQNSLQAPIDNDLIKSNKKDYVSMLECGVELKHLGRYEQAKEMYIKAIQVDNTHPNGYYNLGKVLYILGEYEASARAYKAAYTRGICELMSSMKFGNGARTNLNNFYIHLGHALIDAEHENDEYTTYVEEYRIGVDPYRVKGDKKQRGYIRTTTYNEYDTLCIQAAEQYLKGDK